MQGDCRVKQKVIEENALLKKTPRSRFVEARRPPTGVSQFLSVTAPMHPQGRSPQPITGGGHGLCGLRAGHCARAVFRTLRRAIVASGMSRLPTLWDAVGSGIQLLSSRRQGVLPKGL